MKAKKLMMAGCMTAASLMSMRAEAGPYPMDQLIVWLRTAEAKLDYINAAIAELERTIDSTKHAVTVAERMLEAKKNPRPEDRAKVESMKANLAELTRRLRELHEQRTAVLNYIEWIRVQMEAWDQINNPQGGKE